MVLVDIVRVLAVPASMPNMQMPGNGGMPNMNSGNGMPGMNHQSSNYFANARFGELVIELNQTLAAEWDGYVLRPMVRGL